MNHFKAYSDKLCQCLEAVDSDKILELAQTLSKCSRERRQVFLCGNGGSAGTAEHITNDLLFGVSQQFGSGLRAHALSANSPSITCLANDIGYGEIFAAQLSILANPGDLLIVFSGSGNSSNIIGHSNKEN